MKKFLDFFVLDLLSSRFFCFDPFVNLIFDFDLSNFLSQHQGTTHKHHLSRRTSPR